MEISIDMKAIYDRYYYFIITIYLFNTTTTPTTMEKIISNLQHVTVTDIASLKITHTHMHTHRIVLSSQPITILP